MKITKKALRKYTNTVTPYYFREGYGVFVVNDKSWHFRILNGKYITGFGDSYSNPHEALFAMFIGHQPYLLINYGWEIVDDKEDLG